MLLDSILSNIMI